MKLQEVCHLITDGKHGDCQNEEDSGYYFLSAKDVRNGTLIYENARQITKADFLQTHKRTQLEYLDILIVSTGATIGRMAIAPDSELTSRTTFQKSVAILKPNQEIVHPYWLFYKLRQIKNYLINLSGGTAQGNLLLRDLRATEIDVPPLPVQRKIAAVLSAYDDLIEVNTRRIRALEEMAGAVYREWFGSVDAGSLPEEWKKKSFVEVCERVTSGGTPARKQPEYWDNGEIEWFKTKELTDSFLFSSEEKISQLGFENSSAKIFPAGTVVMAIYAAPTVGRLGILTQPSTFNQAACGLIPKQGSITTSFLFFKLLEMRDHFNNIAQGAAQQNISVQKVSSAQLALPPFELIQQFDVTVLPMLELIRSLLMKNANLRQTRDLLLPRLVSGEVEV